MKACRQGCLRSQGLFSEQVTLKSQLAAMAADPEIQVELRKIKIAGEG
jgi:hypothetical protein